MSISRSPSAGPSCSAPQAQARPRSYERLRDLFARTTRALPASCARTPIRSEPSRSSTPRLAFLCRLISGDGSPCTAADLAFSSYDCPGEHEVRHASFCPGFRRGWRPEMSIADLLCDQLSHHGPDRQRNAPRELSGGEAQRSRYWRAQSAATGRRLLMLDEPFSAASTWHRAR